MSIRAETSFSLKDQLFNAESVGLLSAGLLRAWPEFRRPDFESEVLERLPDLELKERIDWIVTVLESHLPSDFESARGILYEALPEPLDPARSDDDFGKFIWIVPGEYVARHGCTAEHLGRSLDFLREATKRFSSEGAIRPFLRDFPERTLVFVHECAADENYHVRRLASEGIRPLLPWAIRVQLPLDAIVQVLDRLHADRTRFVTRSVANALNDVSRIDSELAVETIRRWREGGGQSPDEMEWMTRHALRTLLKQDHGGALELLGYPTQPKFRIGSVDTTARVRVGENFVWRCRMTSLAAQRLKINLVIHFLKANGKHSQKVFAIKDAAFSKGERIEIEKRQLFKPVTTRVLYPGTHYAELLVNGIGRGKRAFELVG